MKIANIASPWVMCLSLLLTISIPRLSVAEVVRIIFRWVVPSIYGGLPVLTPLLTHKFQPTLGSDLEGDEFWELECVWV
jgi:hypothetical protein